MRRRLIKIAAACVFIVAAVYGCAFLFFPKYYVRLRLTLEVKDGDQVRTGSGVIEVEYPIVPDSLMIVGGGANNSYRRVIGAAVTVDLGANGLLFLTFTNARRTAQQIVELNKRILCILPDVACLPFYAYAKPGSLLVGELPSQQKAALDQLLRQSGPRDVPFIALPRLVRFLDVNDKTTEKIVSPLDLSASFGPGVELNRVVLELTHSAITPAPQIWPQWLKDKKQNTGFEGY
jgi:hypothetical protein